VSTTGGPYVGLDYFVEDDAALFFGRDGERRRIIGNLRASRLTLLYAQSGVGKTSLLRAGVSARIRQLAARSLAERGSARYVPVVFSSWRNDPTLGLIAAIEAAVRPLLGDNEELALPRDALEHALERVAKAADATPLVILDQFEEHFLYEPDGNDSFDDDLARCVNRRDLRANFLISVREDAYSVIGSRFKARIPDVYGNYLHLDFLDAQAAREAVLEPVKAFNERQEPDAPRFDVEASLVEAVLEQVRRGRVTIGDGGAPDVDAAGSARVETAYLQLVMKRLWDEEVAAGSHRLRLETLEHLGGADTIVRGHLDDVLAKLPDDQRDAAAAAFRFLVTSSGRKIALSSEELRDFSEADGAALEPALEHLERERILRPVPSEERGGVARHEIYHDVIAPAVLDWRRRHVEQQRRAETEGLLAQARQSAHRLEVRNRRLAAAVIALASVAIGLFLYLWDPEPVQRLELGTIDTRFSVRGSSGADSRIVMIAVDDRTLKRFGAEGTGVLPRGQYAPMLERLRQNRPAVIALDVVFRGSHGDSGDRELLAAIRATRDQLVLPFDEFTVVREQRPGGKVVRPVLPEILGRPVAVQETGVITGYAGLPDDKDGRNRRAEYEVAADSSEVAADNSGASAVTMPTFAFAAAQLARRAGLSRQVDDVPTASRRAWGGQTERTTWIDYRGPAGTIRRVSALDVIDGRVPAGEIRDKALVIGVTAQGTTDSHLPTPLDPEMLGAEVQANALDTILRGEPLRDVPQPVDIIAIVLLACLPVAAALRRSVPLTLAVILALAVAILAAAQLAFQAGWILAVVVPLAGLVAAALGVAALGAAGEVRRRRAERSGFD
jgi:CHASE2 domain-containing sensor protein